MANNTSNTGGGTALILINGPGAQAITGNADFSRLPANVGGAEAMQIIAERA